MLPLDSFFALNDSLVRLEPYPLAIRSSSAEITEAVRAALHGPDFLEHLSAGGLGPASPPWVAPIPWQSLVPVFHPQLRNEVEAAARVRRPRGEARRA